jgi:hypothetical protein
VLPVDPKWKADYAVMIKRLIVDGIDVPLANLFRQVTVNLYPEEEVTQRARSAVEAFLYRRLETLPETAGRFRLNFELPIPFNGLSCMEVDLLCTEARN